mmetsp:Transcript_66805/g.215317  ORF Transcript_66805/g.215317 Transcript_66805/m.215317 type:complete len:264 (-) Transcript_66805:890-1681(-)
MEAPGTRVVRNEAQHREATARPGGRPLFCAANHHRRVPSVHSAARAFRRQGAVELAGPSAHNPKLVAVQVPGMCLADAIARRVVLQHHLVGPLQLQLVEAPVLRELRQARRPVVKHVEYRGRGRHVGGARHGPLEPAARCVAMVLGSVHAKSCQDRPRIRPGAVVLLARREALLRVQQHNAAVHLVRTRGQHRVRMLEAPLLLQGEGDVIPGGLRRLRRSEPCRARQAGSASVAQDGLPGARCRAPSDRDADPICVGWLVGCE